MKNLKPYETDASQVKGKATNVLFPRSIAEVKAFIRQSKHLCIRGGGTGLAGGCVPQNETVIDISKLNKIGKIDLDKNTIEVEAGVILDDLQDKINKYGLEFPVKPSSHAVCTIGGMIATNAVGSRAIRYGKTSDWIKWIEIVNSNSELVKKGKTDLSDYAGMEGITGIIVKACLQLKSKTQKTASLVKINDPKNIENIVQQYKRKQNITMIEFIDKTISNGIGLGENYNLIVEYEDNSGDLTEKEYDELMDKRDNIYPFLAGQGFTTIEDPKIMLKNFDIVLNWLEKKEVPVFGHISVGIIHPCFRKEQEKFVPQFMQLIKSIGGKVTGEHGIGLIKKEFVDINDKKILINIKKRTDPKNKFNIGKVI